MYRLQHTDEKCILKNTSLVFVVDPISKYDSDSHTFTYSVAYYDPPNLVKIWAIYCISKYPDIRLLGYLAQIVGYQGSWWSYRQLDTESISWILGPVGYWGISLIVKFFGLLLSVMISLKSIFWVYKWIWQKNYVQDVVGLNPTVH